VEGLRNLNERAAEAPGRRSFSGESRASLKVWRGGNFGRRLVVVAVVAVSSLVAVVDSPPDLS
jgi:hypothetical protein